MDDSMQQLHIFDVDIAGKRKPADDVGEVLRYVGFLDVKNQKGSVELEDTTSNIHSQNKSEGMFSLTVFMKHITQFGVFSLHETKRKISKVLANINVLKTNTTYPSRKIRRIRACTHQRPQKIKDQYAIFRRLNTPYSRYGINIIFWKISNVVPTPRNPQYAISNTWIRRI
ncbi:hypothetical protein Tco_1345974 [Tanacetum coccineum]